jgi:hypothetical protein
MDPIEVASTEIINALAVLCTVKALATFRGTLVILTGPCMLSQIHSVLLVVTSTSCFQVPLGSLKALYHETFSPSTLRLSQCPVPWSEELILPQSTARGI